MTDPIKISQLRKYICTGLLFDSRKNSVAKMSHSNCYLIWICLIQFIASFGESKEWRWIEVVEEKCNDCRCLGQGLPFTDSRIQSILSKPRYGLYASQQSIWASKLLMNRKKVHTKEFFLEELHFFPNGDFQSWWGDDKVSVNLRCKVLPESGSRIGSCEFGNLNNRPNLKKKEAEMYEAFRTDGYKMSVVWTDGTTTVITYCYGREQHSDYVVSSRHQKLNKKTKEVINAVLANIGFDMSKMLPIFISGSKTRKLALKNLN